MPHFDVFADDFATWAADNAYNARYDRPTVLELLGDVAGLRVLDAGYGPGLYAEELVARGAEVVAVDHSPRMVELAVQRLGDRAGRSATGGSPSPSPPTSSPQPASSSNASWSPDRFRRWRSASRRITRS